MAIPSLIIKRISGGDYLIDDLGIIVPNADQTEITDLHDIRDALCSAKLHAAAVAADLVLNDGSRDIPVAEISCFMRRFDTGHVDDVTTYTDLPGTGIARQMYLVADEHSTFMWNGSGWTQVNVEQKRLGGIIVSKFGNSAPTEYKHPSGAAVSTFERFQSGKDNAGGAGFAGASREWIAGGGGDAGGGDYDGGPGGDIVVRPGAGGTGSGTGGTGAHGKFKVWNGSTVLFSVDRDTGVVKVGTGTPGHLDLTGGELYVQGKMEVNGVAFFDDDTQHALASTSQNMTFMSSGSIVGAFTAATTDGLRLAVRGTQDVGNNNLILCEHGVRGKTYGHTTLSAAPTFFVHSSLDPDTDHGEYLGLSYLGLQAGTMETDRGVFDLTIRAVSAFGTATVNKDGGIINLVPGKNETAGTGTDGIVKVWHPDEGAGKYVSLRSALTQGFINAQMGTLILQISGGNRLVISSGYVSSGTATNILDFGKADVVWRSFYLGQGASSGLYIGNAQEANLWYDNGNSRTEFTSSNMFTINAEFNMRSGKKLSLGDGGAATDLGMWFNGAGAELDLKTGNFEYQHGAVTKWIWNASELYALDNHYFSLGTGGYAADWYAKYTGTNCEMKIVAGEWQFYGGASEIYVINSSGQHGWFGATPVAQHSSTGQTAGFTAGVGTAVNDDSTFTGGVGSTAYTIGDVVKALKNYGLMAA